MTLKTAIFTAGLVNVVAGGVMALQKSVGYEVPNWGLAIAFVIQLAATYSLSQFDSWKTTGN